jgi:hypothetical protein
MKNHQYASQKQNKKKQLVWHTLKVELQLAKQISHPDIVTTSEDKIIEIPEVKRIKVTNNERQIK